MKRLAALFAAVFGLAASLVTAYAGDNSIAGPVLWLLIGSGVLIVGGCSGGPGQKEKEINKNVGTAVRAILAKKLTPSGKKLLFRGCCFIMNSSTNWNLREEQKCK